VRGSQSPTYQRHGSGALFSDCNKCNALLILSVGFQPAQLGMLVKPMQFRIVVNFNSYIWWQILIFKLSQIIKFISSPQNFSSFKHKFHMQTAMVGALHWC